jgi:hypothetical protein
MKKAVMLMVAIRVAVLGGIVQIVGADGLHYYTLISAAICSCCGYKIS